jgi:hypothetical protein
MRVGLEHWYCESKYNNNLSQNEMRQSDDLSMHSARRLSLAVLLVT